LLDVVHATPLGQRVPAASLLICAVPWPCQNVV
jgi:hypothetical protein